MVILLTSIEPYVIMISAHSGVGPRFFSPGLNGPIIMSISTPTSCIVIVVIFISIPTLISVSKNPLGIMSVIWSHITLSIVILVIATSIT